MRKEGNVSRERGFTLIELVLVIALLGILASVGLPKFFSINENAARLNARAGVLGAIRTGLILDAASDVSNGSSISYPATLDSATTGDCTDANLCFGNVLASPVVDGVWEKSTSTANAGKCYQHNDTVLTTQPFYVYNTTAGSFSVTTSTCP